MNNYKKIKREELKKWLDEKKDFVLIDVLSENSYEGRHLPEARNEPFNDGDFIEKVGTLVSDKNKPVVVYCASFTCQLSPRAAQAIADAGYANVYDFKGGLADWQDAGYSFEGEITKEQVKSKCSCCN